MNEFDGNLVSNLIIATGSLAEVSHAFYSSMMKAGASEREAEVALQAFIHSIMPKPGGNA